MPVKIEGITRLGLLEMTRKRKGESSFGAPSNDVRCLFRLGASCFARRKIAGGHRVRRAEWRLPVSAGRS